MERWCGSRKREKISHLFLSLCVWCRCLAILGFEERGSSPVVAMVVMQSDWLQFLSPNDILMT